MCEVVKAYQREQFIAYYFMHILLGMPGMQAGQVLSVHHTRIRRYVILHLHSLHCQRMGMGEGQFTLVLMLCINVKWVKTA